MHDTLRRLDLNLLVTLDALLVELNVTRAAQRLHLAQPTVSVQLARLRELLDDPLLLPGPRGCAPRPAPKPCARRCARPWRRCTWPSPRHKPSTPPAPAKPGAWRPPTMAPRPCCYRPWQASAAPRQPPAWRSSTCNLRHWCASRAGRNRHGLPHCRTGAARAAPALVIRRALRAGGPHRPPRLKRKLTLKQFCALEQVIVSPDGGGFYGPTDAALAEQGLARQVVLSVPHFMLLASVLASSDLVAMLPQRLVAGNTRLKVVEAPLAVRGFEMLMLWPDGCIATRGTGGCGR